MTVFADPPQGPVGLLRDGRDGLDGAEEEVFFHNVVDVGVDQQRVGLTVDVFHHHLETVEAASFGHLDLSKEACAEVLEDDAVGRSEEGEHHLHEVLLVLVESLPVLQILREVDLLGCPETGHLLLVHLPNIVVPDRKDDEAVRVVLQERLRQQALGLRDLRDL